MAREIRPKIFTDNPRFGFLPEQDKYLFSSAKPKYKLNVIGTGTIGQEHIYVTTLEGRAGVNGIYDIHPGSVGTAQQEFAKYSDSKLVVYDSLDAACQDPAVDGLVICTPNHTHLSIVKTAVASGKHILLEKPMATTLRDSYAILKLANEYPAVLQIGLQYRFKAIYVEAIHEALERKSLGEIKTISMLEHRPPFLDKVGQWNKFSRYSGGTLVEKCCHYFDLMNLFAQARPAIVFASGNAAVNFKDFIYDHEKSDIVDNAYVIIIYENDIHAQFSINMFCPNFYEELVLCGDAGRLKAHEEFDYFHKSASESRISLEYGENRAAKSMRLGYPAFIEQSGHHGSTFFEHQAFIDNIEGKDTHCADVEQGLWAVIVGIAAETSIRENRPVEISELLKTSKISLK